MCVQVFTVLNVNRVNLEMMISHAGSPLHTQSLQWHFYCNISHINIINIICATSKSTQGHILRLQSVIREYQSVMSIRDVNSTHLVLLVCLSVTTGISGNSERDQVFLSIGLRNDIIVEETFAKGIENSFLGGSGMLRAPWFFALSLQQVVPHARKNRTRKP